MRSMLGGSGGRNQQGPPRLAELLLRLLAPIRYREQQLGDLREAFAHRQARGGRSQACRWYRLQVLKSIIPNLALRVRIQGASVARGLRTAMQRNGALTQDLRFTVRSVQRRPAFHLTIILVFALGIGANTIIFSVVDGVLLSPLPFPDPDGLVVPWQTEPGYRDSPNPTERGLADRIPLSFPIYRDWAERNSVFETLGVYQSESFYATEGGRVERVRGTRATHGVFTALRVPPSLGRTFNPEDDGLDGPRLAVLSHGWWQKRFGSDSTVVGRSLVLDGETYTVVGVMPRDFRFPDSAELWVTFSQVDRPMFTERDANVVLPVARLRPGVTLDRAQREMEILAERLEEEKPIPGKDRGVKVVSLRDEVMGRARPELLLLLGAVGAFLLIACANIANLLMVRAWERRTEMVVRLSLGAGRSRILRQLLTEGLTLSAVGGLLGSVAAFVLLDPFLSILPPDIPRLSQVGLDHRILAFSALLTVLSGVIVSALPVLRMHGPHMATALQETNARTLGSRSRAQAQAGLLVSQIALAFLFLFAAGLLIRSFDRLTSVDRGFQAGGVIVLNVDMGGYQYVAEAQPRVAFDELIGRLEAIPGVLSVATTQVGPFLRTSTRDLIVETSQGQVTRSTHFDFVSSSYFQTMGISILEGRTFLPSETYARDPVVLVSEAMAQEYWPNGSAIGQTIGDSDLPERTIVGVVRDTRYRLDTDPFSLVYYPPAPWGYPTIVLKAAFDPTMVLGTLRAAVAEMDNAMTVSSLTELEDTVSSSVVGIRVRAILLGALAVLAATLAVVGVFSVLSFSVAQRTREIGIRMALGAGSGEVVGSLVWRTLTYLGAGIAVGMAVSLATFGVLRQFLFETGTLDPGVLGIVLLLLGTTAIMAAAIPARSAASVDPVQALKQE